MKNTLLLGGLLIAAVCSAAGATTDTSLPSLKPPFRFDGYIGAADDLLFALTAARTSNEPARTTWRKIGQQIGDYEVEAFNRNGELLTLRAADGTRVEIRLVDSRVSDAATPQAERRAMARARAKEMIATFTQTIRQEHPGQSITVNPDIALMPEKEREGFLRMQEKLRANGQYLTSFRLPDGRYGRAISGDELKNTLPAALRDSLTADDVREINSAWALARAEQIGLSVPPR